MYREREGKQKGDSVEWLLWPTIWRSGESGRNCSRMRTADDGLSHSHSLASELQRKDSGAIDRNERVKIRMEVDMV